MSVTVVVAVLVPILMLGLGGLMTEIGDWYRDLNKPAWNPPNWLFAPAWTLILGCAGWSGYLAWTHTSDASDTRARLCFFYGAIVILHLLWSPLFFKLKRPDFSLIEILLLWLSILATILGVVQVSALAAWLLSPYFVWVSFATVLNLAIVRMNSPFGARA